MTEADGQAAARAQDLRDACREITPHKDSQHNKEISSS